MFKEILEKLIEEDKPYHERLQHKQNTKVEPNDEFNKNKDNK